MLQANQTDPELLDLHSQLTAGKLGSDYTVQEGLLLFKGRMWVPDYQNLRNLLLHEFHSSLQSGHRGFLKTYKGLGSNFFWPRMKNDVQRFVEQCPTCQTTKYVPAKPQGLLQPLPIPSQPWVDISMDFIVQLPKSFTAILVVVDRFSKSGHFEALKLGFSAKEVARVFIRLVVKLHGFPSTIVSDRDPLFLSCFWRNLFEFSGTRLHYSTAYHPQSDGQTEVVNHTLEQYLRVFTHSHPKLWASYLPWAEFCYNGSFHSSIQMSPHEALYGFPMATLPGYSPVTSTVIEVDDFLRVRDILNSELAYYLQQAQARMKKHANNHRRDKEFNEGDWVLMRIKPYRQRTLTAGVHNKLGKRFYGPYQIIKRVGRVAYRLALPEQSPASGIPHFCVEGVPWPSFA